MSVLYVSFKIHNRLYRGSSDCSLDYSDCTRSSSDCIEAVLVASFIIAPEVVQLDL